jgi:hypothetical protein
MVGCNTAVDNNARMLARVRDANQKNACGALEQTYIIHKLRASISAELCAEL